MLENFESDPLDAPMGEEELALSRANLVQFAKVAKWARYAGISSLSKIGTFVLIILWGMLQSGESVFSAIDNMTYYAGFWEWMGMLLVFAYFVVSIVIGLRLLSLGKKAQKAVDTGLPLHMEFALKELALFYKIIGIVFAVSFVWGIISWLGQTL